MRKEDKARDIKTKREREIERVRESVSKKAESQ